MNLMQNRVLCESYKPSNNFFESDALLQHYVKKNISSNGAEFMHLAWQNLGACSATTMNELSLIADKATPELVKRNFYGENIDEIRFHPAYDKLLKIAIESNMFSIKWDPLSKKTFLNELHSLGFVSGYLYAMSECGVYCPLCMTDGVARLIDKFCEKADKERILPHIYTHCLEDLYTGAMFLTEKSGGSDVGANLVSATHLSGNKYQLNGEKWFCSNANAQIAMVLARTNTEISGTKGLSLFLVEKHLPNGTRNSLNIIRLKEKLGVRSMASAEIEFTNTVGILIGTEGDGFAIMSEMINLSRLYNSVAASAVSRRALIEAYQFAKHRNTFGKNILAYPLVQAKFYELSSINCCNFYLTFRAIKALDESDNGNLIEKELLRLLTPMTKKFTAENAVYLIRESMELLGGIGYIEDGVMPKLLRDALVLPIWEGTGNIMILDMLRAVQKTNALNIMLSEIEECENKIEEEIKRLNFKEMLNFLKENKNLLYINNETTTIIAKQYFEQLTQLWLICLHYKNLDEISSDWILPSLNILLNKLKKSINFLNLNINTNPVNIKKAVAWEIN